MSRRRITKIRCGCLVVLVLLLTGCWNLEEIENRAFVLGVGFDLVEDGRVRATIQVPSPETQAQTPGTSVSVAGKAIVVSAEGETPWQALGEIDKSYPRKIYLGHLQSVVIGETLAERGIDEIVDGFMRFSETDRHARIFLAEDARAILSHEVPSMVLPGLYLRQFYVSTNGLEGASQPEVWRLWRSMVSVERAGFVPYVRIHENEYYIGHYGVFRDGKLAAKLEGTASRGLNWLRGDLTTAAIPVRWREGIMTVRDVRARTVVTGAGWQGDVPFIKLHIMITADGEEVVPVRSLFSAADYGVVEQEIAKIAEAEALEALATIREAGADLFMWGEWVRASDPRRWEPEKWPDQVKDIEVELNIKVKLLGTDLIR